MLVIRPRTIVALCGMKVRSLRQLRLPLGVTRLPASAVRDLLKKAERQPRSNKFGAQKTVAENRTFDSKREAIRYLELRRLEDAGEISELECQPAFPLVVNGMRIGEYRGDFRYVDRRSGDVVTEDVKSLATKTATYRLKIKLVAALHGVKIREVY